MKRRDLVLVGAGGAAAVVGATLAWRSSQPRSLPVDTSAVWTQRFDRPGGGELALAELRGKPLLLNFWATWCVPCVREMPMLDKFQRSRPSGGLRVVGLAVDSPTPVREYLARTPMSFAIGLAGFGGVDLSKSLGNAEGALPFSVLFDRGGAAVRSKLGALTEAELAQWAALS